jgi:hypothetical protein
MTSPRSPDPGWTRAVWVLLIVTSAIYFLGDNEADNDLWIHLLTGKRILLSGHLPRFDDLSYTAAGAAWVDHEWLSQIVLAEMFALGGGAALWIWKSVIGLLTAWLVWLPVSRRSRSFWVRGPVMILVVAVLARGFAARPQILTYLGLAALLAWLDRRDGEGASSWMEIAGVTCAFVLWENSHAGFAIGIAVLGLMAMLPPRKGSAWRWATLLAATAAIALNPYGPSLFAYVAREISTPHPITEWQPVSPLDPTHLPFLLLLGALVVTAPFARTLRRRPWFAVLVAIVAVMGLVHRRHTPLLAVCAATPVAEGLEALLSRLRQRSLALSATAVGAIGAGLLGLSAVQVAGLARRLAEEGPRLVYRAADYPVGAVAFLRARGMGGNLALPLGWGGYVLWHTSPAIKVSLDGRFATVYSARVVEENFAFFRNESERLLTDYATDLVLTAPGLSPAVRRDPAWHVIYRDEVSSILARGGEPSPVVVGHNPRQRIPFP